MNLYISTNYRVYTATRIHYSLGYLSVIHHFVSRDYLLGLCNALRCQPLDDIISLTSNMSRLLDPNATTVMSGLPIIYNSEISFNLQIKVHWWMKILICKPWMSIWKIIYIYPFCSLFEASIISLVCSRYPLHIKVYWFSPQNNEICAIINKRNGFHKHLPSLETLRQPKLQQSNLQACYQLWSETHKVHPSTQ